MHVETLNLELTIKKVRMHINKVFKNNRILSKFFNFKYRLDNLYSFF